MARSILIKLFAGFLLFCFLILMDSVEESDSANGPQSGSRESRSIKETKASIKNRHPEFVEAFNLALAQQNQSSRFQAIKKALSIAEKTQVPKNRLWQKLLLEEAKIHQERWHYHFAIESMVAAQSIKFDRRIDKNIKRLKAHLAKVEKERNFNSNYIATRGSGPAKSLQGKVLVAYIFIDDGIKTRWSKKSIERSAQVLSQVQKWHKKQSQKYQINDLSYENKVFYGSTKPKN